MTYYDELGLSRKASAEEIRDAYKQLARLLHPDRQQDEKQRSLAEGQMKRLNHIYETLTHPERRREYDLSLKDFQHLPEMVFVPEPPPRRRPHRNPGWSRPGWEIGFRRQVEKHSVILAALAGAFVTYLFLPTPDPAPAQPAPTIEQAVEASPAPVAQPRKNSGPSTDQGLSVLIANLRNRLRQAEQDRDYAMARLRMMEKRLEESHANRGTPATEITPAPAPVPIQAAPPPPSPAPSPKAAAGTRSLSGRWYYVKPAGGEPARNLYPPEYIECAILDEAAGLIRGRYRARYRVTDRAISPEVVFQFAGAASRDSAVLSWTGAGGATGEVRIRLVSANTMELAWVASDLGRYQGLGYGTAVLVRRQEP